MRRRFPRITKGVTFLALMALSAVLSVLPPRVMNWLDGTLQPLIWLQWALSGGARQALNALDHSAEPLPTRDDRLQWIAENERLKRQVQSQALMLREMEERLVEVTRLRAALGDATGPLIYASVLAGDSSPRRDAILIGRGSRSDPPVQRGEWVISGFPAEALNSETTGRDIAQQSALVGQIEEVFAYASRVRLVSDSGFGPIRARVAKRLDDGTVLLSDEECLVLGAGHGRLRIDDAPRNYLADGYIGVLTSQTDALPTPLVIGKIESAESLAKSALHFDLSVKPAYDRRAAHVYVIQSK